MGFFTHRFRIIIAFGSFLCLASINSNYIVMNFTFICMENDMEGAVADVNGTLNSRFYYAPVEKRFILWAVAAGAILGTVPINWAYKNYGVRLPLLIAGILSILATTMIPIAASSSFSFLLVLRLVQGIAYSGAFTAIENITATWAPLAETGLFMSLLSWFIPVSTSITNLFAGWICDSALGWRGVFYLQAFVSAITFIVWSLYYTDNPITHKSVDTEELKHIQQGKTDLKLHENGAIPSQSLFRNHKLLIIWFNTFAKMTAATLLVTFMPLYYHKVLHFDVFTTGILSTFTTFLHVPVKSISGYFSDSINWIPLHVKVQCYNFIAVGFAGICCLMIGIVKGTGGGYFGVILFGVVYCAMAVNSGDSMAGNMASRQYAHFVSSTIHYIKCAALVAAPASWAIFVQDETDAAEWSYVFYLNGAMLIVANLMFVCIYTEKTNEFTCLSRDNSAEKSEKTGKQLGETEEENNGG